MPNKGQLFQCIQKITESLLKNYKELELIVKVLND